MKSVTKVQQLLGTDLPIIMAPMAGASNAAFVAAVSNTGALGSLGAASISPTKLEAELHALRQQTNRSYNVNLFSASTESYDETVTPGPQLTRALAQFHSEHNLGEPPAPRRLFGPADEQLDVLLAAEVPVISFHFGVDAPTVAKAKSRGAVVLCSATTVAEARSLEAAGVDLIIAQGAEAGGHRGTFEGDYRNALIGTMALVPQVVDAVSVPVIAAGGIMDARGVLAALSLGAGAAQMGTAFLGCTEAPIPKVWQQRLGSADASDTRVTLALSGKPARGLANRYVEALEVVEQDEGLLPYPAHYSLSAKLRAHAAKTDNADFLAMWAGQGVGLLQQHSAAELVEQLMQDLRQLNRSLSGL